MADMMIIKLYCFLMGIYKNQIHERNGVGVFTTRKCIAMGYKNDFCRIRKWGTGLCRRFKILYSPMGNPPNIDFHYRKKHFGVINATMFYCYLHFINL